MIISILIIVMIFAIHKSLLLLERINISRNKKYKKIDKIAFYEVGQGKDLIVLLSGSGIACPFTDMHPIFTSNIQSKARLLIIDRLGSGISDDTTKSRNIDIISDELIKVIKAMKVEGKTFLVGHSLAGLLVMRTAQRYSETIDGIVLLDSPSIHNAVNFKDPLSKPFLYFLKYCRIIGLLRFYTFPKRILAIISGQNPEYAKLEEITMNKNYFSKAMLQERLKIKEYGKTILKNPKIKTKSVVITSNNKFSQFNSKDLSHFKNLDFYNLDTQNHFIHHNNVNFIVDKLEKILQK